MTGSRPPVRPRIPALLPVVLAILAVVAPGIAAERGEDPAVAPILARAAEAWERVEDYTCVLHRQERHGERLLRQRGIRVKFRKPYSMYLRWTEGAMAGTEALYVRGRHGGKLLAHSGGLLGFLTLRMDPRDPRAMKDNRHPIDQSSIGDLVAMVVREHARSRDAGDGSWTRGGEDEIGGRPADVVSASFPPGRGYYAKGLVLHFDRETGLPLRMAAYREDGALLEEYGFDALRTNVGLSDRDFDPDNPEYRF